MDSFVALFNGSPENVAVARHAIAEYFRRYLTPDLSFDLEVAVGELLTNCVLHGCADGGLVEIDAVVDDAAVTINIKDPGEGFDIGAIPTFPDALHVGGYGLTIAKELVDEMRFEENGTRVVLIKRFDSPAAFG